MYSILAFTKAAQGNVPAAAKAPPTRTARRMTGSRFQALVIVLKCGNCTVWVVFIDLSDSVPDKPHCRKMSLVIVPPNVDF
jgi:hypothetical protein